MRVARSRELVAQGRPAALVARVAGISRQAIYRRPKRAAERASGARWTRVDRVVLGVARDEPDRRDPDGRRARVPRGRRGRSTASACSV